MPIRPLRTRRTREPLVEALEAEWREPTVQPEAPVILADLEAGGSQVYVVWSRWRELGQRERSEIIMDALVRAKGLPTASRVTLALGLTPEEADRMDLDWRG